MKASVAYAPLLLALLTPAHATEPSGTAVAVLQSAANNGHTLEVKGTIYTGDKITTGSVGLVQLVFKDRTRLVVGPNSNLVIDKFVFDPSAGLAQVSMVASKGAFRFITGVGPKQAYAIKTPEASIGIRGTKFDFSVGHGKTNFVLYEGAAHLCNFRGRCVELSGSCSVAVIGGGGAQKVDGANKTDTLASFPFLQSQAGLRNDFHVNTTGCRMTEDSPYRTHPTTQVTRTANPPAQPAAQPPPSQPNFPTVTITTPSRPSSPSAPGHPSPPSPPSSR